MSEICLEKIKNLITLNEKVELLEEVSSTNDYILDKDLFLVIAKSQTNGKGTNNRTFFSKKGGIYLSLKLTPNVLVSDLPLVTPYTAVAVMKTIKKVTNLNAKIKWVNDIYINDKKVSGILTESSIFKDKINSLVIGIGINVEQQNFPNFILNTPTSLESECGFKIDKNKFIGELLSHFINFESEFNKKTFIKEYSDNFYLSGKTVTVKNGDNVVTGVAIGVNENCNLVVDIDNEKKVFYSGEAVILK